jgi:hypothetical protein
MAGFPCQENTVKRRSMLGAVSDDNLMQIPVCSFAQINDPIRAEGVRQMITDKGVSMVSVTQSSDPGGWNWVVYAVPYCRATSGFEESDPPSISAYIADNSGSATK